MTIQNYRYIRTNHSSIKHVASAIGILYGYTQTILKQKKMDPYKINFVHHLHAGDSIGRLEFIAWFNIKYYDNPLIVNHILLNDKSKFTNYDMNSQNHQYWVDTNPHWFRELMYGVC
jgi:hypothetical protein